MKTWDKVLTLAFLAYFISCSHGLVLHQRKFIGTLEPIDTNVCPTQNITFTSTLLKPALRSYSIGFAVKNRNTHGTYEAVGYGMITEVNETMSQFTVYNITLETEEVSKPVVYFYVRSYYWQEFGDIDGTLQLGETVSARVFPLPEKVQDFKCIVLNYMSMRCTWNYGKDYGENMPEVMFRWRNPSLSGTWINCTDLSIENGYCVWVDSRAGFFKNSNITIKLTLKQKCGIDVASEFHINTASIVKPDPVSSVSTNVINSTCIKVFWDTSDSEPQHPKEHRVIVSSEWDNITMMFNSTEGTGQSAHSRTFCKLRPYTEYTFSVSIQPVGLYSGYFSDERKGVSTTYSDIPSASPEVTEGVYNLNNRDCDGNNKKRRVCVFWKTIKDEHKNGPMKGVQGLFTAINAKAPPVREDWAEDSTYGCSLLLCSTNYIFTIKARNVNGTSDNGSTIAIPSFRPGIKPPKFIVESAGTSSVYVTWDQRETRNAKGFTVVWCRNKNGDCESGHEIYWKHFPSNTKEAVLQINSSSHDFLYGVSVLTEDGSSGVDWQDCVYLKNITPKREPQNVVVPAGPDDNTLVVTWDKLTCKSDEPYIAMYNVQYNKPDDINQKSVNVTGSGEARVVLTDMQEDQIYFVTVRGITKDGRYGPESQQQKGVPENKSLKPSEIAGISVGVVVAVCGILGVVCCLWKCKIKAKKMMKEANITIPDSPDAVRRQNSYNSVYNMIPQLEKTECSATETHSLEKEPTLVTSDEQEMPLLQAVTSETTEEAKLKTVISKPIAFAENSENGISYPSEENNVTVGSLKNIISDYEKWDSNDPSDNNSEDPTTTAASENGIPYPSEENNVTVDSLNNIISDYKKWDSNDPSDNNSEDPTTTAASENGIPYPIEENNVNFDSLKNIISDYEKWDSNDPSDNNSEDPTTTAASENGIPYPSEENNVNVDSLKNIISDYEKWDSNDPSDNNSEDPTTTAASENGIPYPSEENNVNVDSLKNIIRDYEKWDSNDPSDNNSEDPTTTTASENGIPYPSEENNVNVDSLKNIISDYEKWDSNDPSDNNSEDPTTTAASENGIPYPSEENNVNVDSLNNIISDYEKWDSNDPSDNNSEDPTTTAASENGIPYPSEENNVNVDSLKNIISDYEKWDSNDPSDNNSEDPTTTAASENGIPYPSEENNVNVDSLKNIISDYEKWDSNDPSDNNSEDPTTTAASENGIPYPSEENNVNVDSLKNIISDYEKWDSNDPSDNNSEDLTTTAALSNDNSEARIILDDNNDTQAAHKAYNSRSDKSSPISKSKSTDDPCPVWRRSDSSSSNAENEITLTDTKSSSQQLEDEASHSNAVINSDLNFTKGNITNSNAVQESVRCDNPPNRNIFLDYQPAYAIESYNPREEMENFADHKSSIDLHSTPTGNVFSTEDNAVCKELESKFQSDNGKVEHGDTPSKIINGKGNNSFKDRLDYKVATLEKNANTSTEEETEF
ncbi:uncharacterized protein LOC123524203 [Mercenaria mercenaria]|uniref:uncharacterized protein LOC123524203 n=1 Tax=Mercenaria mercenaria TaxID=6596 RepID=UPI00234FB50E|nr:uncharacterized protein LOC123524203 [Mercenaria mercenaria]